MRLYRAKNYDDMSRKAANILSAQVIMKPNSVLGLATGSSPEGVYKQLIEWYKKGDIDFQEVKTVNLDEYKGLHPENDQSYHYYMKQKFFDHINIDEKNTHIPNGVAEDIEAECKRYNEVIRGMGGVDLQLLGIGSNGHIGFNEPQEAFEKETHCVALTKETIDANARFFESNEEVPKYAISMGIKSIMQAPQEAFEKETHCVALTKETIDANARFFESNEEVPKYAISMGIKSIMQAKKILLIASGASKAKALFDTFYGPITPLVPSSILQLHNDVTVVADEEALAKIKEWEER